MAELWKLMQSIIKRKETLDVNKAELMRLILNGKEEYNQIFDTNEFVDSSTVQNYLDKNELLYNTVYNKTHGLFSSLFFKTEDYQEYQQLYEGMKEQMIIHNDQTAIRKVIETKSLINPVGGKNLDDQQLTSIVKTTHNHLILAGAGTGKTTTIIGLIKYLLLVEGYKENDLLVLSFTNSTANEMKKRVKQETDHNLDIMTFHKLGMNIITEVEGMKPLISKINLSEFIRNELSSKMTDSEYMYKLLEYITFYVDEGIEPIEFNSEQEYQDYLKYNKPITLLKEKVKSNMEKDVANFLYINGIRYQYEAKYEYDTRTYDFGQYYPDFYLPEYKIYIECFGINDQGKAPEFMKSDYSKHSYEEGIQWKREMHQAMKTTLVEVYSYERVQGTLLGHLKSRLEEKGVQFQPIDSNIIWNQMTSNNEKEMYMISELFSMIINLIKNNDCSIEEIRNRNQGDRFNAGNQFALELVEPLYNAYNASLHIKQEIDFNDMINLSKKYIQENKYHHHYKYVIIDEYQDLSQGRYALLKALREQQDYKLFAVGDDWQSIYRFNGSDIGFILNFEKYWGVSQISRIETSYRFSQTLIDITSKFILVNPEQSKKELKGKSQNKSGVEIVSGFSNKELTEKLEKVLEKQPEQQSVLFLGRYHFDIEILKENNHFQYYHETATQQVKVKYLLRPDLKITFQTVHGAKGLEADVVVLLNTRQYGAAFPSRIANPPVLELLLDNSDHYKFAEERRLFYVALTRTKSKVYLLINQKNCSEFVKELSLNLNSYSADRSSNLVCPRCGGKLILKHGKNGDFYGCSNYSITGCRFTKDAPKLDYYTKAVTSEVLELTSNLKKSITNGDFYAFDTETTGLLNADRIVQISIVKFHQGKVIDFYSTYIQVDRKMNPQAEQVNGISDKMLKSAPKEKDIYPEIINVFGDSLKGKIPLVAHNASFDIRMLTNTFERLGYQANIKYIDTFTLAKKAHPELKSKSLEALTRYYKIDPGKAHDAYYDSKACGELLLKLLRDL